MGDVSGDTGGVDHIVEGEVGDELVGLEEEGQWLGVISNEPRAVNNCLTCPMPPEAPATTALTILLNKLGLLDEGGVVVEELIKAWMEKRRCWPAGRKEEDFVCGWDKDK